MNQALLNAGALPPRMDDVDEDLTNKVLESLGLPLLSSPTNAAPMPSSAGRPTEAGLSQGINLDSNESIEVHRPNAEPSFDVPPTSLDREVAGATSTAVDTVSFDDWSLGFNDDGITPDWLWAGMLAPEPAAPWDPTQILQQPSVPQTPRHDDAPHCDDADPEIVSQIAARFGSLQLGPDGKLRYFGTPANAHVLNSSRSWNTSSNQKYPKPDSARVLRNAELDADIAQDFEDHLIQIFFSWHNSCHPVVEESVYWHAKRNQREPDNASEFCSELLTSSMCAIGASYEAQYHPRLVTFPRPLADFFAERAKALLEFELDSPCVSTVQALLLLSSHEAGYHRIARSWLYGGMAMRLCFDLGLHLSTDIYMQQGIISPMECRARHTAFWGSYVMNYRASFSLGRPFALDASEITVEKPNASTAETDDPKWRTYYPASAGPTCEVSDAGPPRDLVLSISERRINLYDMVEPIARALYGNTVISNSALQELSEKASGAMFQWKATLPVDLSLSNAQHATLVPQLLVLHMEYHYLQILVHRPWTSRRLQPMPLQGRGHRHARTICITSACEVASLLLLFEKKFGYRRLNVETLQMLPTAALILIFATVSGSTDEEKSATIASDLNTILRALDETSSIHRSARDHLEGLLVLQQSWRTRSKESQSKRHHEEPDHHNGELSRSSKRGRL